MLDRFAFGAEHEKPTALGRLLPSHDASCWSSCGICFTDFFSGTARGGGRRGVARELKPAAPGDPLPCTPPPAALLLLDERAVHGELPLCVGVAAVAALPHAGVPRLVARVPAGAAFQLPENGVPAEACCMASREGVHDRDVMRALRSAALPAAVCSSNAARFSRDCLADSQATSSGGVTFEEKGEKKAAAEAEKPAAAGEAEGGRPETPARLTMRPPRYAAVPGRGRLAPSRVKRALVLSREVAAASLATPP